MGRDGSGALLLSVAAAGHARRARRGPVRPDERAARCTSSRPGWWSSRPRAAWRPPAWPWTTSTCSCRTRRTGASSTTPRAGWGWTKPRCSPTLTATATPPPARSRSASTRPGGQGRIGPGDIVLMVGFGGGLAWGSCVMEWTKERSMSKIAFCFPGPGQPAGRHGPGAGRGLPRGRRRVRPRRPSAPGSTCGAVSFDGPLEQLSRTEITQPALVAASLAALAGGRRPAARCAPTLWSATASASTRRWRRPGAARRRRADRAGARAWPVTRRGRCRRRHGGRAQARPTSRSSGSARSGTTSGRPTTTAPVRW